MKRPINEPGVLAPQCGCDGVTYWNGEIAAFHGVNIATAGACGAGKATVCSVAKPCEGDTRCNLDQGAQNKCNLIETPLGTCWQLPQSCPDLVGGRTRYCSSINGNCADYCDAIDKQASFFRVSGGCN